MSWADVMTFVTMDTKHTSSELESLLPEFLVRHLGENASTSRFHIQPLSRTHLYSIEDYGITEGTGDIVQVRLLSTVRREITDSGSRLETEVRWHNAPLYPTLVGESRLAREVL